MTQPSAWMLEDFRTGQVFLSQGRTITEADLVSFAGWSWDTNPVHTDAVTQASSRFGQRIAHGVLGIAVAMGLASRIGVFEACSIALLNVRDWSFRGPILVGDTVHVRVEIVDVRRASSGTSGVLERLFELVNQGGEVVQRGWIDLLVAAGRGAPASVEETDLDD